MISLEGRQRIAKMLLLLGSQQEGEILAAARMINKVLQKESKDLHELTKLILEDSAGSFSRAKPHTDFSGFSWGRDTAKSAPPNPWGSGKVNEPAEASFDSKRERTIGEREMITRLHENRHNLKTSMFSLVQVLYRNDLKITETESRRIKEAYLEMFGNDP